MCTTDAHTQVPTQNWFHDFTLQQAANKALGKRMKRRHRRRLILWNEDIKT
jgi:chorismate-pyruvate lyase